MKTSKRPNIIFFFTDQQRPDTIGCYGQKLPVTPCLDALAKNGTVFTNAYTCQPVCGPARACLQSGKYATEVDCHVNGRALPRNIRTLADCFTEGGYETAYIGKWHLATNRRTYSEEIPGENFEGCAIPPERRGGYRGYWVANDVMEFNSEGYNGHVFTQDMKRLDFVGYRADCITDYAIDFVHQYRGEKPFFMFLSHLEPHHQNSSGNFEGPDGSRERFKDFEVPGDLLGAGGDWAEQFPGYLGQCNALDRNVGKLVDALKERGEWENTILIYSSDHGNHFKTRNSEYKRSCHDDSIHVPLICLGGIFEGGGYRDELVSLIDFPRMFLELAGIEVPEDWQGRSIVDLMTDEETKENWENSVFVQISESQVGRAVRTKDWKYSVRAEEDGWFSSGADVYYEDFLYDLNKDPYERNNLVNDPTLAEVRKELAEKLIRGMVQAHEKAPVILPAKEN